MQHTFSIIYAKKAGILIRLALVVERQGHTIESMSTHPYGRNPMYWEMVITTRGDLAKREQVKRQLTKLIDICEVQVLNEAYCPNNLINL
jgi:acetolactate synthase small subunit